MATADERRSHWQHVWTSRAADAMSWFEPRAERSLQLIRTVAMPPDAAIIDVGGGASMLVDGLLEAGFGEIAVLDVSAAALAVARARLGARAALVRWVEADVLVAELAPGSVDVWHDRAVFHFLTDGTDRAQYVRALSAALRPGGHAVIACFAPDGPEQCSGLPVVRYDTADLERELGAGLEPIRHTRAVHVTPGGRRQSFLFSLFRRRP